MHLGVDFGTTRTIVAYVDRGNYPVVSFVDPNGDAFEYFPSVVALADGELVFGFDALQAGERGDALTRSFKRALASPEVNTRSTITVGDQDIPVFEVLVGFFRALKEALSTRSNIQAQFNDGAPEGEHRTVIAVPAHAHSAQRFLTLEAFRRAGFSVTAMINEPSAAGFEYTHRQGRTLNSRRTRIIVYDLGGGTFDASLVRADGKSHEVLDSIGLNRLGGDDFDAVLAECAVAEAGLSVTDLAPAAYAEMLDECRAAKEHLTPQSKRLSIDVATAPVSVSTAAFYTRATPLVESTVAAMAPLVGRLDDGKPELSDIAGIYLVGGASGLPLVPRLLREHFGRRVHRSPYPAASTAIGLAIAADAEAGYSLTDRLSRGFGVFREGSDGQRLQFDPIFARDREVSRDESVVVTRRYRAVHNVGWFRFVEYAALTEHYEPSGDIMPFAEVLFPYDKELQHTVELRDVPVRRHDHGSLIEERYVIDPHGIIEVHITDLDTGYTQSQTLQAGAAQPA